MDIRSQQGNAALGLAAVIAMVGSLAMIKQLRYMSNSQSNLARSVHSNVADQAARNALRVLQTFVRVGMVSFNLEEQDSSEAPEVTLKTSWTDSSDEVRTISNNYAEMIEDPTQTDRYIFKLSIPNPRCSEAGTVCANKRILTETTFLELEQQTTGDWIAKVSLKVIVERSNKRGDFEKILRANLEVPAPSVEIGSSPPSPPPPPPGPTMPPCMGSTAVVVDVPSSHPTQCVWRIDPTHARTSFSVGFGTSVVGSTLAPGSYGNLIKVGGTLTLGAGDYYVDNFTLTSTNLVADATLGSVRIFVRNRFTIGTGTNVTIVNGDAGHLCLEAHNNGSSASPGGFVIGSGSSWRGTVFLPGTRSTLGSTLTFTGNLYQSYDSIGAGPTVTNVCD